MQKPSLLLVRWLSFYAAVFLIGCDQQVSSFIEAAGRTGKDLRNAPENSEPVAPIVPKIDAFAVTNTTFTSNVVNLNFAFSNASEWCILLSDKNPASCSWSSAAPPATFTLTKNTVATEGSYDDAKEDKTLYAWVRDSNGQVSQIARHTFSFNPAFPIQTTKRFFAVDATFDNSGNLWVLDYGAGINGEAVRFVKYNSARQYQFSVGRKGSADGQFNNPSRIAVDSQGNVWIADSGNKRIQKFDSEGNFLMKFGTSGTGNGQFSGIYDMVLDSNDNIYTYDGANFALQKFDRNGNFLWKIGSSGTGNGQFGVIGYGIFVAVDASGQVFVCDTTNKRIQKFNSSGGYLSQIALTATGAGNGQFNAIYGPGFMTVDSSGNFYVYDSGNNRIQKLDSNGAYVSQFSTAGTYLVSKLKMTPGGHLMAVRGAQMMTGNEGYAVYSTTGVRQTALEMTALDLGVGKDVNITSLAVDGSGNIYAADTLNSKIYKYNSSGVLQWQIGSAGSGNGQFGTVGGLDITSDSSGNIFVADPDNFRIQKFDSAGNFIGQYSVGAMNSIIGLRSAKTTNKLYVIVMNTGSWLTSVLYLTHTAGTFNLANTVTSGSTSQNYLCIAMNTSEQPVVYRANTSFYDMTELVYDATFSGPPSTKSLTTGFLTGFVGNCEMQPAAPFRTFFSHTSYSYPEVYDPTTTWVGYYFGPALRGLGNGDLNMMSKIAVDSNGYFYVADRMGRIQKFNSLWQYQFQ